MTAKSRANHLARNVLKQCSVESCQKRRQTTSRWCPGHAKKVRLYGSPTGRPLRAAELRPYKEEFAGFMLRYVSTPQVRAAVKLLDDLLSLGRVGHGLTQFQLHRLRSQGVTGMEALQCVAAVFLLSRDRPALLPDDRQLTMAIGAQLFKLRPLEGRTVFTRKGKEERQYVPPPAVARREVGELVRSKLGTFMMRVEQALHEEESRSRALALTLATPFNTADLRQLPSTGNLKQ